MQSTKKNISTSKNGLHNLMEAAYLAHKRDIYDYAGGHLNPDKLKKLPGQSSEAVHIPWKSSQPVQQKDIATENPYDSSVKSRNTADLILVNKLGLMKNALMDFSLGTVGSLPSEEKLKSRKKKVKKPTSSSRCRSKLLHGTKSETKLESMVMSEIEKLMGDKDGPFQVKLPPDTGTREDTTRDISKRMFKKKYVFTHHSQPSTFVEEIKLPELMLPSVDEAARVPPSLRDPQQSVKQQVHRITDKKFVTTHLAGITRRDQYNKILDFDRNVLHRYETMEKKVRDGHKAVEHLEQKLVRSLLMLNERDSPMYGLNFERLQAYGEVWRDLCDDSSIYGTFLSELKEQYDDYLSSLLDEMRSTNHVELVTCLNAVGESSSKYTSMDAEEVKKIVVDLEEESRRALLENAELQECIGQESTRIEEERRQRELEEEQNKRRMIPHQPPKKIAPAPSEEILFGKLEKNTEVRLKELRADVWEKLDTIAKMQTELRTDYVPKSVFRNLQHAVTDTESEMQKLMQQNEYLSKNMAIQEQSLENVILRYESRRSFQDLWMALKI